jgi:hypothetical protein
MKLATVDAPVDLNMDNLLRKDVSILLHIFAWAYNSLFPLYPICIEQKDPQKILNYYT